MAQIIQKGNFNKAEKFLKRAYGKEFYKDISDLVEEGLRRLEEATPQDTGLTAKSWTADVKFTTDGVEVHWNNENIQDGFNVALLIQYGHATRNGGYVEGNDYINPAIGPVMDKISEAVRKEMEQD